MRPEDKRKNGKPQLDKQHEPIPVKSKVSYRWVEALTTVENLIIGDLLQVSQLRISARRLLLDAFTYVKPVYFSMLAFFVPSLIITLISPTIASPSASFLLSFIDIVFLTPFMTGASIFYAHQNLTRRGATVPLSLQAAGERFFQLSLLTLLVIIVLIPAFVLLLIPGIYLSIRWSFVFYAIMIEGYSASDALSRSWNLTQGHWWLIGRTALLFILAFIVPIFFLSFILVAIFGSDMPGFFELVGGIIGCLLGPLFSIYYVLLFMSLVNMAVDE
ncbi:hypothetical protein NUACC21_46320 [Scytonema sp. NUACC21]